MEAIILLNLSIQETSLNFPTCIILPYLTFLPYKTSPWCNTVPIWPSSVNTHLVMTPLLAQFRIKDILKISSQWESDAPLDPQDPVSCLTSGECLVPGR
uniref:Uncharacterized protein n=1 Tax=Anguilla anguilla TaxID=7936 RepID=A0A0E9XN52_ANGAN